MSAIPDKAYATAIFQTAQDAGALEDLYADFQMIDRLLKSSDEFNAFLRIRSNDVERAKVIRNFLTGKAHALTLKAIEFLAAKNRLEILRPVAERFLELYRKHKNIAALNVSSYGPLDEALFREIESKWAQRTGKTVEIDFQIDPSLLGGIVFKIEDQVHDFSIKQQLEMLHRQLIEA